MILPFPLPPFPLSAICLPLWDLCDLSLAIYFLDLAIFCASKHEIELEIFEQRPGERRRRFYRGFVAHQMLQLLKLVVVNIVVAVAAVAALLADAYRVRHWANFFMAHNWPN